MHPCFSMFFSLFLLYVSFYRKRACSTYLFISLNFTLQHFLSSFATFLFVSHIPIIVISTHLIVSFHLCCYPYSIHPFFYVLLNLVPLHHTAYLCCASITDQLHHFTSPILRIWYIITQVCYLRLPSTKLESTCCRDIRHHQLLKSLRKE